MKKIAMIFLIIAAVLAISGCYLDYPSYELESRIISVETYGGGTSVRVNYSLENTGYERMNNVQIVIELEDISGRFYSSRSVDFYSWDNDSVNLSSGEEYYGSVSFSLYSAYLSESAVIVSVGWDSYDDDGW